MNTFRSQIKYLGKERASQVVIAVVIFVIVTGLVAFSQASAIKWWTQWLDPIFGAVTFLVALGIWMIGLRQDWENNLPKLLTVKYIHHNKPIMECRKVYLSSVSDIRAWGQQLGAQMAGTKFLQMEPFIQQDKAQIIQYDGEFQRHYTVTFHLTQIPVPDAFHLSPEQKADISKQLQNNGILWERNPNDKTKKIAKELQDE